MTFAKSVDSVRDSVADISEKTTRFDKDEMENFREFPRKFNDRSEAAASTIETGLKRGYRDAPRLTPGDAHGITQKTSDYCANDSKPRRISPY